ncbi:MAG: hypothetical protein ABFC89_07625 [Methanospirillum sp.]
MRWWRSSDAALAGALLLVSAAFYAAQLLIFADPRSTEFYILQDVAFLPISVLVVTLVLERLLELRDRRQRLEKLRMLIGTFFSWTGYHLLFRLALLDGSLAEYAPALLAKADWTDADFVRVRSSLVGRRFDLRAAPADLAELKPFLHDRAEFMIRLLENPMLLEHESFTELLRAVFHLIEELEFRRDFAPLPQSDIDHLTGDCDRVYHRLIIEWVDHLRYLREHYPYLYSLAVRTNPYNPDANPIVGPTV